MQNYLFGTKKPSADEQRRKLRRTIDRTLVDLSREARLLAARETASRTELKTAARQGRVQQARILAQRMVRAQKMQDRILTVRLQMEGLQSQVSMATSMQSVGDAMRSVTRSMIQINQHLQQPQLQSVIQDFMRENERMETRQEHLDDVMEDAFSSMGDADDEDAAVQAALDEVGLSAAAQLGAAPSSALGASQDAEVANLLERAKNLS